VLFKLSLVLISFNGVEKTIRNLIATSKFSELLHMLMSSVCTQKISGAMESSCQEKT